ncbi:MAG: coiled-coil protein [Candidatus Bathyarchaeia archaeon]
MSELPKKRIAELHQQLAPLREEHEKLNSEAKEWGEKRDALHEQIKKLRTRAQELKQKRDELNTRVQGLKILREEANEGRKERQLQILKLKKEVRALRGKKFSQDMDSLQSEIEKLEWKIQTTSLTVKEEKVLIDQIRLLENRLLIYKKLQKLNNDLSNLKTEEKEFESKAESYHKEILDLAEQSQDLHKEMLEVLNEADGLQREADNAHQRFLEAKQKARSLYQRIKPLREELHLIMEQNKTRHELEIRKGVEERALEKLKRGEKLTWEEFKVLAEKGIV